MAIDVNIPSQVKTYANLAGFPATGSLKTIFIAEDTNKTYRWTGSAYVEVSGADLSGYVPTTRTLTINGTTQDLSADRTFTVSTGITIGTTAITSGTVGRVLFQGAGNVVQQSSSLFWDATNNRLGIGTSTPTQTLDIVGSLNSTSSLNGDLDNLIIRNTLNGASSQTRLRFYNELTPSTTTGGAIFYTSNAYSGFPSNSFGFWNYNTNGVIAFATSVERMRIASTGNLLINTTTDAGFRLDVNGTARVSGAFNVKGTNGTITIDQVAGGNYLYSLNPTSSAWRDFTIQTNGVDVFNVLSTGRVTLGTKTSATNTMLTINSGGLNAIESLGNISFKTCNTFFVEGTNRLSISSSGVQNEIASVAVNASGWKNLAFQTNGTTATLFTTGNFAINTTTDAGYKLDVNGTARVDQTLQLNGTGTGTLIAMGGNIGRFTIDGSFIRFKVSGGGDILNMTTNFFGVNETSVIPSAICAMTSTTRGFLPPRMTTTQKNAIATPATGLQVFDTTLNQMSYYNGTTWTNI